MKCVAVKLLSQNSFHRRLQVVVVSLLASYVRMAFLFRKLGDTHIAYLVRIRLYPSASSFLVCVRTEKQ